MKLLILLGFLFAAPAWAQDASQAPQQDESSQTPQNDSKAKPRRGAVIELDALTVEGTLQKPYAFFTLGRTALDFSGFDPDASFVDRIYKSVDEPPF